MTTHAEAQANIEAELQKKGWSIAPNAMEPLQMVDFGKLVAIHDHEKHFLEKVFMSTLLGLGEVRASTGSGQVEISNGDIETALRMLGVAAVQQPESTVSGISKTIIRDACGFC